MAACWSPPPSRLMASVTELAGLQPLADEASDRLQTVLDALTAA